MTTVSLFREWLCGFLPGLLLLFLAGCASHSSKLAPVITELTGHNIDAALQILEEEDLPSRDRLLLLMNRGLLLRLKGDFSESNQEFSTAKQLVEEFNAISLREQAMALTINDTTRSYAGAPYEQVLLNIYSALNYLDLGQADAARVEVLQVDLKLAALAGEDAGPLFDNDPLARYLSGIIYEAGGEYSDAMIAYRSAYQAYQQHGKRYSLAVPRQLKTDLLRNSERMGLEDENSRYQEQFGIDSWQGTNALQRQGELVFLFHNGLVPVKIEQSLMVPVQNSSRIQFVRIALPEYLRRPAGFSAARISINGHEATTERVENIEELAVAELAGNMPGIIARSAARAVLKYQVSKETGKQNDLAGLLVNLAGVLTERADTRSWLTLPAEIQLARIPIEPGIYDLKVELLDMAGRVTQRLDYPAVVLEAGKKTFLSYHGIHEVSLLRRRQ
ncbi:MAG: hypothetical protein QNK24_02395 [Desulfuromusa sp.]|nr:hypothetical protein [Desulfuromusa sp.]